MRLVGGSGGDVDVRKGGAVAVARAVERAAAAAGDSVGDADDVAGALSGEGQQWP